MEERRERKEIVEMEENKGKGERNRGSRNQWNRGGEDDERENKWGREKIS